jgi:hypothetical protein
MVLKPLPSGACTMMLARSIALCNPKQARRAGADSSAQTRASRFLPSHFRYVDPEANSHTRRLQNYPSSSRL